MKDPKKQRKGRTPSPEMQQVRQRVLTTLTQNGTMSTPRIAESLHLDIDVVRRALWYYEKQGMVKRSDNKVTPLNGGRPAIVWELVEIKD